MADGRTTPDDDPQTWDFHEASEWRARLESSRPPLSEEERRKRRNMPWIMFGLLAAAGLTIAVLQWTSDPRPNRYGIQGTYDYVPHPEADRLLRGRKWWIYGSGGDPDKQRHCRVVLQLQAGGHARVVWTFEEGDPLQSSEDQREGRWSLRGSTLTLAGVDGGYYGCTATTAARFEVHVRSDGITLEPAPLTASPYQLHGSFELRMPR